VIASSFDFPTIQMQQISRNGFSDHSALSFFLSIKCEKDQSKTEPSVVSRRKFNGVDIGDLISNLSESLTTLSATDYNVLDFSCQLFTILETCADNFAPLTNVKSTVSKSKPKLRWTPDLLESKRICRRLESKYRKSPTAVSLQLLRQARRQFSNHIKKAKSC
jgi:hypothetical protein